MAILLILDNLIIFLIAGAVLFGVAWNRYDSFLFAVLAVVFLWIMTTIAFLFAGVSLDFARHRKKCRNKKESKSDDA